MSNGRKFNGAGIYKIGVYGHLDRRWSDWFDGFTITQQANDETLLTGQVTDQAALHGLLNKIRDLGLPLLFLQRVESKTDLDRDLERTESSDLCRRVRAKGKTK
jgi:hypothetical protein